MAEKSIRVLVVDDSRLMREMLSDLINAAPGMEVAAVAASGQEALSVLDSAAPDLVTLDIQMPGMDGLETLDRLLAQRPLPVIMVSALTQRGATTTLDALDRGALDYVAKASDGLAAVKALEAELPRKIRTMAGTDVRRMLEIRRKRSEGLAARAKITASASSAGTAAASAPPKVDNAALARQCIAIGISTGGPPALSSLFSELAVPLPPIVIVQHMPANFTKSLAWRLDSLTPLTVKEAESGDVLTPNHVYLAPGGSHLQLRKSAHRAVVTIRDGDNVSGHKPSVDVMMGGAAEIYGPNCLGVIMTGMGRDGSDGCGKIRAAGGYTIGQDEETSDVYGMNKVAWVEGNLDGQFGLHEAARSITRGLKKLGQSPQLAGAR